MRRSSFNWGCLIKVIILVAVIMGILLVVLQCGGNSCIKRIDKTLPDTVTAPWEVTTPTHVYLTTDILEMDAGVTLSGWYEQIDGKWVKREGNITLERKIYVFGEIHGRREA